MRGDARSILEWSAGALHLARGLALLTLVAGAVCVPAAVSHASQHGLMPGGLWFVTLGIPGGGLLATVALRKVARARARSIGIADDVGSIIEAMGDTDRDVRTAADAALGPILSMTNWKVSRPLTSEQYKILLAELPVAPTTLAVSILRSLRIIGDHRADAAINAVDLAPDVPNVVREAARIARLAIAERGDAPSANVSQESGLTPEIEWDAASLLSNVQSDDPGIRAEAVRPTERLIPDERDEINRRMRRLIMCLRVQVAVLVLLLAAFVPFSVLTFVMGAYDGSWKEIELSSRNTVIAFLCGGCAIGAIRRMRRLRHWVSESTRANAVDVTRSQDTPILLDMLRSNNAAVRARGLLRLQSADRDCLSNVASRLTAEAERIRGKVRVRTLAAILAPLFVYAVGEYRLYGTLWSRLWEIHVLNASVPALLGAFIAAPLIPLTRDRHRILSMFALIDDPCACGSLLTALQVRDADLRKRALIALERLLPRAEVGDMEDLTDRQVAALESLLASPKPDTVKAALRALTFAGTERSLKRMAKLASNAPATLPDIARYAEGCARGLRERIDAELSRGVLLRPAAAHAQREELLRPTTGGASADGATLLRGAKAPQGKARLAPNLVAHVSAAVEAEQAGTQSSARPTPISAGEVEVVGVQATNSERVL